MNILLPPSRRQSSGGNLIWSESSGIFGADLATHRAVVLDEVSHHTGRDLRESLALPAVERFCGVVYKHIESGTLEDGAKDTASRIHIVSALLGLVGWNDPIPAYRLEFSDRLGSIGILSRYWEQRLVGPFFGTEMVVGLLPDEHRKALRNVTGITHCNVLRADSSRGGHEAKTAKGRFVRALIAEGDLDKGKYLSFIASYQDGPWRVILHPNN